MIAKLITRGAPINNRVILDSVHHHVVMAIDADVVASLRAKFDAVLPHLDERQQRLVMAADARSLGHGGIAAVAGATGAVAVADLTGRGRAGSRVGCQNSVIGLDQRFQAAGSYWLMRPPRIG